MPPSGSGDETAVPAAVPILGGLVVGFVLAFMLGIVAAYVRTDSLGHTEPSFAPFVAFQVAPILVALGFGTRAFVMGRRNVAFFLLAAGIAAILPTAACDSLYA